MKKNNFCGFTIVELVIVIAVIAILAAVLIPTFSGIIQRARDSAELQNERNSRLENITESIMNGTYGNVAESSGGASGSSPEALAFEANEITLAVGTGELLKVSGGSGGALNFTSSDSSVASVGSNGLVTGVSVGTAVITVSGDGGGEASCTVNVLSRVDLMYGTGLISAVLSFDFDSVVFGWKKDYGSVAVPENRKNAVVTVSGTAEVYLSEGVLYVLSEGKMFANADCSSMFYAKKTALRSVVLENFDTSFTTNMGGMFNECENLEHIDLGPCFDTSGVTRMSKMFRNCRKLESIDFGAEFDTSDVVTMNEMFYNCRALSSLDLRNFDTSALTDAGTDSSTNGAMSAMFYRCEGLEHLDLTSFDTSGIKYLYNTFYGCTALVDLDLSSFYTAGVTDMTSMFYNCSSLERIYVSPARWSTESLTNTLNQMFLGCTSLYGYNAQKTGAEKATTSSGGYLTSKN